MYPYKISEMDLLSDLKTLSADKFLGRKNGEPGNVLAQSFIVDSLRHSQVMPMLESYRQPFFNEQAFETVQGVNIAGMVLGKKFADKYIVLTAHYDHLGRQGSEVFNGADDNASGVIALLHYATQIQQYPLDHSVIFVFTDAEEIGLEGAKQFLLFNRSWIKDIKLNVNIDMIAGDQKTRQLNYVEYGVLKQLTENQKLQWQALQQQLPISVKKGFKATSAHLGSSKNYWLYNSDHGAFYQKKIPCVYFGVGSHSNYHEFSDDYMHANKAFFVKAVNAIYWQIAYLDITMQ